MALLTAEEHAVSDVDCPTELVRGIVASTSRYVLPFGGSWVITAIGIAA